MTRYTIGEIAAEFNLTPRTLRFWEEAGILSPMRRGPNRVYSDADRNWIRQVAAWSAAGLTLREIKTMRDLPRALRRAFLLERLPAIQSEVDEIYAKRCRAIEAAMAMIREPQHARAQGTFQAATW